jgi:hypothetical protein
MRKVTTIDNEKVMEWDLTLQEAFVFSWIYSLPSWAENIIVDNKVYYFASKNKAVEDLPMVTDKFDTMYRHYKSLKLKGLIELLKVGIKDYIALTELAKEWNTNKKKLSEYSENNPYQTENNPTKLGFKSESNSENNPTNRIIKSSIDNKKINNKNIEINNGFVVPESYSHFSEIWVKWIKYKKSQHNFSFKSADTELVAFQKLIDVSDANLTKAIKCVDTAMAGGYKSYFRLKEEEKQYDQPVVDYWANERRKDEAKARGKDELMETLTITM